MDIAFNDGYEKIRERVTQLEDIRVITHPNTCYTYPNKEELIVDLPDTCFATPIYPLKKGNEKCQELSTILIFGDHEKTLDYLLSQMDIQYRTHKYIRCYRGFKGSISLIRFPNIEVAINSLLPSEQQTINTNNVYMTHRFELQEKYKVNVIEFPEYLSRRDHLAICKQNNIYLKGMPYSSLCKELPKRTSTSLYKSSNLLYFLGQSHRFCIDMQTPFGMPSMLKLDYHIDPYKDYYNIYQALKGRGIFASFGRTLNEIRTNMSVASLPLPPIKFIEPRIKDEMMRSFDSQKNTLILEFPIFDAAKSIIYFLYMLEIKDQIPISVLLPSIFGGYINKNQSNLYAN